MIVFVLVHLAAFSVSQALWCVLLHNESNLGAAAATAAAAAAIATAEII